MHTLALTPSHRYHSWLLQIILIFHSERRPSCSRQQSITYFSGLRGEISIRSGMFPSLGKISTHMCSWPCGYVCVCSVTRNMHAYKCVPCTLEHSLCEMHIHCDLCCVCVQTTCGKILLWTLFVLLWWCRLFNVNFDDPKYWSLEPYGWLYFLPIYMWYKIAGCVRTYYRVGRLYM